MIYTLGIDTSCDDTAVAVLKNDRVLANVVSSQVDTHREWGGVVPRLARREHEKMIDGCIALALRRSGVKYIENIDVIAVTYGPGLAPALEVGVRKAREMSMEYMIPVVAVNHMEGHALSTLLKNSRGVNFSKLAKPQFPAIAVLVSGGHTEIVWIEELGKYEIIGQTLDDAAGEAFDKIARMLDLGYPGGPVLARMAEDGDPNSYPLPRPMKDSQDYHFSFSGLKTACLYNTNDLKKALGPKKFSKIVPDYCASVQEAIVDSLLGKVSRAVKKKKPKMVMFGGGVSANNRLRSKFRREMKKQNIPVYFPDKKFATDNASMIALVGYYKFLRAETVECVSKLERDPSITIEHALKKL